VDVQVVRQQLADGRALAGQIDGGRVAGLEQERVRLGTRPCIGAEERLHVALQRERQLRQLRPFAEAGQGEIHQHILPPPGDPFPARGVRDPPDDRKRPLEGAEALDDRLRARELRRVRQPAQRGDDLHERLKGLAGFLQPQLRDPAARQNLAAAEAIGEELLAA